MAMNLGGRIEDAKRLAGVLEKAGHAVTGVSVCGTVVRVDTRAMSSAEGVALTLASGGFKVRQIERSGLTGGWYVAARVGA